MAFRQIASVQRVTRDEWGYAKGAGWEVRFGFEPRDLWVGVFWTGTAGLWHVYVCVVPAFPLHLCWWTGR